jgi:predicted phage baseplate assembly protein
VWWRTLLDPRGPRERFTVDPVRYRPIDLGDGLLEYDGAGDTLRFGDGELGAIPADGAELEVTYRAGGGAIGNVAAGAIDRVDRSHPFAAVVVAVTNPLPAEGGADEEPADRVRELAPFEFQAKPLRAVRAEDYEAAAAELPWVQRAGTSFRWTGSWRTVFTAADARGGEPLPDRRLIELTRHLDRRRLAGYESYVLEPRFAALDLDVVVCARPEAFRGDVERGVRDALGDTERVDGSTGFFHPDRWTFGLALERSALEAAIQQVPGVDGVVALSYRRRGRARASAPMPDLVEIGRDEILRVDDNPSRPERGSLRVEVRGGK